VKSQQGELIVTHSKTGLARYQLEIRHKGLHKYQIVRGDNQYVVQQKARTIMTQWDQMWVRKQEKEDKVATILGKKQQAVEKTEEARKALVELESVLNRTLSVHDAVDWESLKNKADCPVPKPISPTIPPEPSREDSKYQVKLGILDMLLSSRRLEKEGQAENNFNSDLKVWQANKEDVEAKYASRIAKWEQERDAYYKERSATNAAIDEQMQGYLRGNDPQAIVDYCDLVLSNSQYPDYFPRTYDLDYNPRSRLLVVDYQLPSIGDISTLREVNYIQSRDEFTEKHISQAQLNKLYDNLLYQVALRTVHELYEADQINALASIVFNGFVDSVDLATGQEHNSCILSLQAAKDEFEHINLANVDPKACFKKLKGVSASKLHSLTPVAPIMKIEREDGRFVSSYAVAESIVGENLAAMDWEDFEHLIRELFEKEFSSSGGEVKVTRASRDGGIDAVVFDPDPLRGGKIVIQAKRYTNTVGVSAVRDLYGTLINEGANKGILVTTADYGPDAHEFARGKPIVLLSGAQLLYLLEKHGHKARIDLKEARQTLINKHS
jgi:restriction system protein